MSVKFIMIICRCTLTNVNISLEVYKKHKSKFWNGLNSKLLLNHLNFQSAESKKMAVAKRQYVYLLTQRLNATKPRCRCRYHKTELHSFVLWKHCEIFWSIFLPYMYTYIPCSFVHHRVNIAHTKLEWIAISRPN